MTSTKTGIFAPHHLAEVAAAKKNLFGVGMHRISGPSDYPAFFDIRYRYPAGYYIALPDIR
jgi:hypothetical protein